MDVFFGTILQSPLTPVSIALSFLALVVLSLMRGWLLPKSTVTLLLEAPEKRAADYKAAWEASEAKNEVLIEYLKKLLKYAETADRIIRTLPVPSSDLEDTT